MLGRAPLRLERSTKAVCPGLRLAPHQPALREQEPKLVQAGRLVRATRSATTDFHLRTLEPGM